jgi:hypothetical protein
MPFDAAPCEYDAVVRLGSGGRVGTWQWLWAARAQGREGAIDHRADGWVGLAETGLWTRVRGRRVLIGEHRQ